MPKNFVYLGFDPKGLREAQADRERHAARIAEKLKADPKDVLKAIACDREWPTPDCN